MKVLSVGSPGWRHHVELDEQKAVTVTVEEWATINIANLGGATVSYVRGHSKPGEIRAGGNRDFSHGTVVLTSGGEAVLQISGPGF